MTHADDGLDSRDMTTSVAEHKSIFPNARPLLYLIISLSLAYLVIISFTPRVLTGTPEYHWPVLHHGVSWRAVPAALLLLAGAWLALGMLPQVRDPAWCRADRWRLLLMLFLFGLLVQAASSSVHRLGLLELPLRVYLPDHTSYFTDAVKVSDWRAFCASYPEDIRKLATHSRTHPPGAIAFFYLVNKAVEGCPALVNTYMKIMPRMEEARQRFQLTPAQAAGGGMAALLLVLAAGLAVPATFILGNYFMPREPALLGALLFSLTPAYSHKAPLLDHAFGLFILVSSWWFLRALRGKSRLWAVASGVIAGLGLWFSPTFLALPVLVIFLGAGLALRDRKAGESLSGALSKLLRPLAIFGIFLFAALLLVQVAWGVSFTAVYKAITELGWYYNNTVSGRVHPWMWILFNPYEFLAWQGMPVLVLVLASACRETSLLWRKKLAEADWFVVSVLLFSLALDLSGRVCYEASRLCWFLMPLTCLVAGKEWVRQVNLHDRGPSFLLLALMICFPLTFRLLF